MGTSARLYMLKSMFRVMRNIARLKRRAFRGDPPHWFNDALAGISYVNVLRLAPTFFLVAIAPEHFFRNLRNYLIAKPKWFQTPLKYFTAALAFLMGVMFFFAGDTLRSADLSQPLKVSLYLAVVCLAAPILIPLICIVLRMMLMLASALPNGRLPKSIKNDLLIPLSLFTYRELMPKQFGWSIFYFGIYFYCALQFFSIIALVGLGFGAIVTEQQISSPGSSAVGMIFTSIVGILALIGIGLLVTPYVALLRVSVGIPTGRQMRSGCFHVRESFDLFGQHCFGKGRRIPAGKLDALTRAVDMLEQRVANEDKQALIFAGHRIDILIERRHRVFSSLLADKAFRLDFEMIRHEDVRKGCVALVGRIRCLREGAASRSQCNRATQG